MMITDAKRYDAHLKQLAERPVVAAADAAEGPSVGSSVCAPPSWPTCPAFSSCSLWSGGHGSGGRQLSLAPEELAH